MYEYVESKRQIVPREVVTLSAIKSKYRRLSDTFDQHKSFLIMSRLRLTESVLITPEALRDTRWCSTIVVVGICP